MTSPAYTVPLAPPGRARPAVRLMTSVRAGVVCWQALLLLAAHSAQGWVVPPLLLASCVAIASAATMLALLHLRRSGALDDTATARQIVIDVVLLSGMLALSGGPENTFHDAFFLPVVLAAALLAPAIAWPIVAISLAGYAAAQFFFLHIPGTPEEVARALHPGELITHVLLIPLAAYFVLRITRDLRDNARQLGEARERAARADCAVAVGTIAAGAAHELGTPLMTISAVVEDLRDRHGDRPELQRSLDLLDGGVAECRKALEVLRESGRSMKPQWASVGDLVERIQDRFHLMCPACHLTIRIDTPGQQPMIGADLALQQAVVNLLSNAAAVSPQCVTLSALWDRSTLTLRVIDHGPGVPPDLIAHLGSDFVTTKPGGFGVGLFLTRVTAQRLGGSFNIRNASDHTGAVAELVLPLASLQSRSP